MCVLTWAAERLLCSDAPVAGGAQRGGGHGQRGEQVTVAGAGLSFPGFPLSLLQPLLLFVLQKGAERWKSQTAQLLLQTGDFWCLLSVLVPQEGLADF